MGRARRVMMDAYIVGYYVTGFLYLVLVCDVLRRCDRRGCYDRWPYMMGAHQTLLCTEQVYHVLRADYELAHRRLLFWV